MPTPGTESRREIARIEAEQRRLDALLTEQQRLLRRIEEAGMPDSTPYISYKRGTNLLDLAGPPGGIRTAFKNEIAQIQSQIRRLRDEASAVRRTQRHAEVQRRRAAVARIDRKFEAHLRQVIARANQKGHLEDGELAQMRATADEILNTYTDLLGVDSSEQAIGDVLRQFGDVQVLGDGDPRIGTRAMKAIVDASKRNITNARRAHGKRPSVKTARGILRAAGLCESVGGDGGTAVHDTGAWAEQQMKAAEKQFRRTPTAENMKQMFEAEKLATSLGSSPLPSPPPGLKRLKAGEQHTIANGDTLSGLAKTYYGSFAYWDVFVRANKDLWENPDRPPSGTIRIPF